MLSPTTPAGDTSAPGTADAASLGTPNPPVAGPLSRFAFVRGLARGWWLFLLRGVAAILFGVLAFLFPLAGATVILAMIAAWLAVDGVFTLWHAVAGPKERSDRWLWLDGLASLAAAALIFFAPGLSLVALVVVAAAWSAASGVVRLVLAWRARSVALGLLGALGVLVGVWLVLAPGAGLVALVWVVATQAVIAGALLIGLGWRLRRVNNDPTPG